MARHRFDTALIDSVMAVVVVALTSGPMHTHSRIGRLDPLGRYRVHDAAAWLHVSLPDHEAHGSSRPLELRSLLRRYGTIERDGTPAPTPTQWHNELNRKLLDADYHTARLLYRYELGDLACKARVLDVYGTQHWANSDLSRNREYCCLNLPYLQQFWTDIPAQAPGSMTLAVHECRLPQARS